MPDPVEQLDLRGRHAILLAEAAYHHDAPTATGRVGPIQADIGWRCLPSARYTSRVIRPRRIAGVLPAPHIP